MSQPSSSIVVLAGGFGGAKLSHGLLLALWDRDPRPQLTVIVNTADDLELHGLHISPDLDTVMYTLAGLANDETGWGVRGETWSVDAMLQRYGRPTWFRLGDQDIATHLVRTSQLRSGASLTEATAALVEALEIDARLLPMTDDRVRTQVRTPEGWLAFQDYFVRRGHRDQVLELRFEGIENARPTAQVLEAIDTADQIVFAPSNPFVSIGPIVSLPGVPDALRAVGTSITAVCPIVDGAALRGPADQMLVSLGSEASAAGVVRLYQARHPGLIDRFVIDEADAAARSEIEALGMEVVVTDTVMRTTDDRRRLGAAILELA